MTKLSVKAVSWLLGKLCEEKSHCVLTVHIRDGQIHHVKREQAANEDALLDSWVSNEEPSQNPAKSKNPAKSI